MAYDEVMRGDAYTYVRQTTCVLPQALPIIAGHLWIEPFQVRLPSLRHSGVETRWQQGPIS